MNDPAAAACLTCVIAGIVLMAWTQKPGFLLAGVLAGLYFLLAIKVVSQWERVAVLRLGRYAGLRGPGTFTLIPIIDTTTPYGDQQVRVSSVSAESTLTRDTVPADVDAAIFWLVWNTEKALLEVESFNDAIALSAQTALRESIGRHSLALMLSKKHRARSCKKFSTRRPIHGASPRNRSRSATFRSRRVCRMPCRAKLRPNASATPVSCWATLKLVAAFPTYRLGPPGVEPSFWRRQMEGAFLSLPIIT